MSMRSVRTLTDNEGTELAGYQKKMLSMHATAYITILDEAGQKMAIATIKKQSNFQFESSAG